uniref:Uncharacterized protein n=1 Tax=Anguilla anguilla TaxID=7936 RepID=A0A0E9UA78_ANGAN
MNYLSVTDSIKKCLLEYNVDLENVTAFVSDKCELHAKSI